ncbi:MAG TPA: M67 family metallopeptidase [Actinomycetota bacterium]|jgi:proteasome lid subunit RPN8/RPN11|nr:M67 family metallopeptidase [Actinomycetota bacterium]
MKLTIPQDIYDGMIQHCRDDYPNEACGFISGLNGECTKLYPLPNAAASPIYYRPGDKEMIAAINDIDERDEELVAIFHSHVASAPVPSPTDRREAHYPDAVYLIVSLMDGDNPLTRGWLIKKQDWRDETGDVIEVDLVIS